MNGVGIVFLRVNASHWSLLNMWLEILILGAQSSSISYTQQIFEYTSFFNLSLTSYDLFPHGWMSWAALAAVQKALEEKRNQMEKYTWILSSWSQSLLSCFSLIVVLPVSWVDVKRGLTHFYPLVWLRKDTRKNWQRNSRLEEVGNLFSWQGALGSFYFCALFTAYFYKYVQLLWFTFPLTIDMFLCKRGGGSKVYHTSAS